MLSAKGDALVARLIPLARQYEAAAIAGLSREELLVLKRCLRRVYGNMKSRSVTSPRRQTIERRSRSALTGASLKS